LISVLSGGGVGSSSNVVFPPDGSATFLVPHWGPGVGVLPFLIVSITLIAVSGVRSSYSILK